MPGAQDLMFTEGMKNFVLKSFAKAGPQMARGIPWISLKMSNWYAKVWQNSAAVTPGLKNKSSKN